MHSVSSVTQLCPTLCDPMNFSMPGLPVHHQLPEFTQTHVHGVGDAIQPSHPLLLHAKGSAYRRGIVVTIAASNFPKNCSLYSVCVAVGEDPAKN